MLPSNYRVIEQLKPYGTERHWVIQRKVHDTWSSYHNGSGFRLEHHSTYSSKADALKAYEILSADPGTIIIAGGD